MRPCLAPSTPDSCRQPVEDLGPRSMNGDEILDLVFEPVNIALILVDRAQLVVVEEHGGVAVSVEPGAEPLYRVRLVLVIALDQKIWPVPGDRSLGPGEDGELVA